MITVNLPMSTRENLFRPVHKGLRSMIFTLGLRLGTTDFSNVAESNEVAKQLKQDLTNSLSNCILCLLQTHSTHEEKDFFSAIRPLDEEPVRMMTGEHAVILRRTYGVAKQCDELLGTADPLRRIELGDKLVADANDLFTYYLAHLNNEEAVLVPVMWEHFTDAQLRALRAQFYNTIPLSLFETWMRWTLPALNINELVVLLSGMKIDPAPNRFADALRLAKETLRPEKWSQVQMKVGD